MCVRACVLAHARANIHTDIFGHLNVCLFLGFQENHGADLSGCLVHSNRLFKFPLKRL